MSTASLAPPHPVPPAAASPAVWPRQWSQREALLERQHDRLEALLDDLVERHGLADEERSALELLADCRDCRLLLRGVRLHLRLEERWLAQCGCLCPGHRAARLPWLMDIQQWFDGHRRGPDAVAYARAATLTPLL